MKKTAFSTAVAIAAASALLLTGTGAAHAAASKRACVILPDADSGTRWESSDRPALANALKAAGFVADIQNAQKDTAKYATIADAQLAKGCGVMLLVNFNNAADGVVTKAKAQGIPTIAYDRPIAGASYYVSFDNVKVGALEGQTVLDGLKAAGKDPKTASIVYGYGDPTDGNAAMFKKGGVDVLTAAGAKPAAELKGTWDGPTAGTEFEQAYTTLKGKVDAVLSPNDNNADAIIQILKKNNQKAVISGQDASIAGLQNILLGYQTATVYKPGKVEAKAASDLAIKLLKGQKVTTSQSNDGVPFIALNPILVKAANVKDVVKAGDATVKALCTTKALKAACAANGIK
jgi:D-xylose transport system substrate-binding protein